MKVGLICPDDLSVVLFCKGMIHELLARPGVSVVVLSDYYGSDAPGRWTREIESWGAQHVKVSFYRFVHPTRDFRTMAQLRRALREHQVDMALNISTKPNIYGTFAARSAGIRKVVCSVWGMGAAFQEDGGTVQAARRRLVTGLYRLAFRLSSKIWFTNRNDFEDFTRRGIVPAEKAILTKNYVNTDEYAPGIVPAEEVGRLRHELGLNDDEKVVIMVGRMSWAKGIREFVDAARLLRDRVPRAQFILVGPKDDGSADAVPDEYLDRIGDLPNCRWVGFREDVKALYALSDLAVLPSFYREGGFPRALTEPMAMGKPVVTTDSVHCRGTVEEGRNGYLVPTRDAPALAEAIERVLADEDHMRQLGEYSRVKAVREFDETAIVGGVITELMR